ncbi:hypothetical protein ACLKA7_001585 [Drosophila subpalustris]
MTGKGEGGHGCNTRKNKQDQETSWESEQGAAGFGPLSRTPPRTGAEKPPLELPKPTLPSVEASAVNAMLAQAHLTFLKSQSDGICQALREEMKLGFMEIMKAINDVVRPKLPVFDAEATEEQLLDFDEDAAPVAARKQQGAKPKQAAELKKPAPPNPEALPPRTLVPEAHSCEHRPVDLRSSHWRNPFSDREC